MTRYVFKMPDLGEGTVEAVEVVWSVMAARTPGSACAMKSGPARGAGARKQLGER